MAASRLCSIPNCGKKRVARGLCSMHYLRQRRHGDPAKRIRIANGEARAFLDTVVADYDGDECLFWPFAANPKGVSQIRIKGELFLVSRLVCAAVHGEPPTPKHEAAHSCGNGHLGCVTRRHLRWATYAENRQDMIDHGRSLRGQRNPNAKVSPDQVRQIRALQGKLLQREIGEKFGISEASVSMIHRRVNWAWLP